MLNLNAFHDSGLPYVELPPGAHAAALESLSIRKFTTLEQYDIFSAEEDRSITANILAFAHPIHRTPEYTGLTVFNAVDGYDDEAIVRRLAMSTAPFHLIHRNQEFSFWTCPVVDHDPKPRRMKENIAYAQLHNALSEYEIDLKPERIIDVKQGLDTFVIFRNIEPLQLSLWATDVNSKRLTEHFSHAVTELRRGLRWRNDIEEKDSLVTTLAIQLLGAIILADTGVLGDEIRLNGVSLSRMIWEASKRFGSYFNYALFQRFSEEIERAYRLLHQIRYAGFVPDMLSDLYRAAYSKQERKVSGSYNTPLHLTRRIWKNIPVEFLPPSKRIVADMTCGWGSFLVAGHERLSGLKDMENVALHDCLYGNDDVRFSSQLAGLALLLTASDDSWHIDQSDAQEWGWLNTHQPTIIVGNPPFEADRRKADPSGGTKRRERANLFLEHAINHLAPGGYLAMVMPRSFIAAQSSPELRKKLLESCDLFELWELPTKLFTDATARTIVLFAQKHEKPESVSHHPVRARTVQPDTFEYFRSSQELTVTASGLVSDQSLWNEQKKKTRRSENIAFMDYKIILSEQKWAEIQTHCAILDDYAIFFRGVTRGTPSADKSQKADIPSELVPCLLKAREVLKTPFLIDYSTSVTVTYPDDFQWPRIQHQAMLARPKVIMVYTQDPSWGHRARVAVERRGYYVSDDFWILAPTPAAQKQYISLEVLAAIVSWDVSNAWLIEHMSSPSLRGRAVKTIPFPRNLSKLDCMILTEAVRLIEAAVSARQSEPQVAIQAIDRVLKRAYGLDDDTFHRLRQIKEWDSKPLVTLDPPPTSSEANWFISGIVRHVNPQKGTITLWMDGFDELQTVQIVPAMPGWMLHPGIAFRTKIPRKYIKRDIIEQDTEIWGSFQPQPYTYMSEEELFAELVNILHTDEKYRV
jgi:hypothetical protein